MEGLCPCGHEPTGFDSASELVSIICGAIQKCIEFLERKSQSGLDADRRLLELLWRRWVVMLGTSCTLLKIGTTSGLCKAVINLKVP